jgi:inorganic pyrophosphatase/exopolyphosphatase
MGKIYAIGHVNPDMDANASAMGYAWLFDNQNNVVDGASHILMQGAPVVLEELPYRRLSDGTLDARGVVSRKKQLLPVVLALLEE